jgi:hypothetical protein
MSIAARIDEDCVVAPPDGMLVAPAMLRAQGLSKQYGAAMVLTDVTLDVLPRRQESHRGRRRDAGRDALAAGDDQDRHLHDGCQSDRPGAGSRSRQARRPLIPQANAKEYYFPDSPF